MTVDSFNDLVKTTVEETLARTLGADVWKAISFYFDVKTVATDPEAFGKVLEKMFGNTSRVLKQVIGQTLMAKTGGQVDQRKDRDFLEWIQIAKTRFLNMLSDRSHSMIGSTSDPQ